MVATALAGFGAAIAEKRAEAARIQAAFEEVDHRVGDATEEYDGARYRLSQVEQRIGRTDG